MGAQRKTNMKCPDCKATLKKVKVAVAGASSKATSFQCPKCDYFEFEQASSQNVLEELSESPLKIKQKIIKLSGDRLGIYLNKHVVESLKLKKGNSVYVSVPDDKHILIGISG